MKAPTPTTEPATAFMVAAAPVDWAPVAVPEPEAPDPDAPEPVVLEPVPLAPEPEAPELVGLERTMVVLLLAETTTVWVVLAAVPAMTRVVMPVPTAGIELTTPTEVATAGMEVSAAGLEGCAVTTEGWPVTTPRELVSVRRLVCGKASTDEDCHSVRYMSIGLVNCCQLTEDCANAAAAKAEMKKAACILAGCWVFVGN